MMRLFGISALERKVIAVVLTLRMVWSFDNCLANVFDHEVEWVHCDWTRLIPDVVVPTPILSWILEKRHPLFGLNLDMYNFKAF